MERKVFDPKDWIDFEASARPESEAGGDGGGDAIVIDATGDVESVVRKIEEGKVDITGRYAEWRNIGFALASAFGEGGRDYFHRVSCFYNQYSKGECDKQYTSCLKGRGNGVTLKSFFYYAQQAGIKLTPPAPEGEHLRTQPEELGKSGAFDMGKELLVAEKVEVKGVVQEQGVEAATEQATQALPTLPAGIYEVLPEFLKKVVLPAASDEERDILLLGSMAVLSAALPSCSGIYDGKKVYPNLYLFVTAKASAGKGRLVHCKQLVQPIHKHLREQAKLLKSEYDVLLLEYNQRDKEERGEKPGKPAEKMLLIPANNSTTGVFQLLHDNEGRGMIFETEGDTLAQAFKSDYGNYSDGFRKAFHHETISYYRRTDREYVDIESPCVSTVLSGTPKQVAALIPNAENGLFSRFLFYYMHVQPVWKDVFAMSSDDSLDAYFGKLGAEYFKLYKHLEEQGDIAFSLTGEQRAQFNQFFEQVQGAYVSLKGLDYLATVRRLGLIAFRMCMILTALRIMEHGGVQKQMVCEDRDFATVLELTRVLVKHAAKVFSELPEEEPLTGRKNRKERFYEVLPKEFGRKVYLEVARRQGIPDKTAQRYIVELCKSGVLHHDGRDRYENALFEEMRK